MRAFCYASGLIEFGRSIPDGALPIASGSPQKLKPYIEVNARHGYKTHLVDGRLTKIPGSETLLVPGVPEALDQSFALDALINWRDWISKSAPKGVKVFG